MKSGYDEQYVVFDTKKYFSQLNWDPKTGNEQFQPLYPTELFVGFGDSILFRDLTEICGFGVMAISCKYHSIYILSKFNDNFFLHHKRFMDNGNISQDKFSVGRYDLEIDRIKKLDEPELLELTEKFEHCWAMHNREILSKSVEDIAIEGQQQKRKM